MLSEQFINALENIIEGIKENEISRHYKDQIIDTMANLQSMIHNLTSMDVQKTKDDFIGIMTEEYNKIVAERG